MQTTGQPSTIDIHVVGALGTEEGTANAAISPGHLVEIMSTGNIRKHATAGGTCEKAFAIESKDDGGSVTTDYATGEKVYYRLFQRGERVMGRLFNGEVAVIGDKLESQGDGTLRVVDPDASFRDIKVDSIVGTALQAVDMSGSNAVDPANGFIIVRVS